MESIEAHELMTMKELNEIACILVALFGCLADFWAYTEIPTLPTIPKSEKKPLEQNAEAPASESKSQAKELAAAPLETEKKHPEKAAKPIPEKKLQEQATVLETKEKPIEQVRGQDQTSLISAKEKIKQKSKHDVATETDFDAGAEPKLSGFTTVLFGPYHLVPDGTKCVKCIQVGKGDIRQYK